jgi:hypothetical protein
VLNPTYMTSKYREHFYVLDMRPGEGLLSNTTHSVSVWFVLPLHGMECVPGF